MDNEKCSTLVQNVSNIKGILLDITGVLYESGEGLGSAICGSIEAIKRLREAGYPIRFCTNETMRTRKRLVERLRELGFDMRTEEVFSPIPAMCSVLRERNLRPHVLVYPDALSDFSDIDQSNPNCVVIGDAAEGFTYDSLNKAFQVLISLENPLLFSLGNGKFYKDKGSLCLDVGSFAKALEFACDIKAEVVGKPSSTFFNAPLKDMGMKPEQVMMVGDDIVNDVGGAQACGMYGVQVRTGKFRPQDENHPEVTPDAIVNNLAHAVDILLENI